MKKLILVFVFISAFVNAQKSSISFTENKGQVSDQFYNPRPDVLFSGTDGRLTFHLKNNGISYQLNRVESWKEQEDERTKEKIITPNQSTIYRLDLNWLNINVNAQIERQKVVDGYTNYYLPTCANGAIEVKSYKEVIYKQIYTGINLKWYEKDGHLKYDYIVGEGADYKQIQIEINGSKKITINNKGELVIKTPLGNLIEQAPVVIQGSKILRSKWQLISNKASFFIEGIDPAKSFIIDPAVRSWGTYYGSNVTELEGACSTDASGNVYLSGYTNAATTILIATVGSFQNFYGGSNDAFLAKFDASGVRQWATYYGDASNDRGFACSTDGFGNIFLMGQTTSSGTFFATAGAHQSTGAGIQDAFLAKFNASGVLQWSTYYGGAGDESCYSCCTDVFGNVFLCGRTASSTGTIIATATSHQPLFNGATDAFLVKFNGSGVRQWGTYYGGSSGDDSYSCCTDPTGNVYLSGFTSSSGGTVIATLGSHQTNIGGGNDAFLVKFNTAGIRQWATYYGGAGSDLAEYCATDASGNIFICGVSNTSIGTAIATAGAHQPLNGGGANDAFLVKFDNTGTRVWGTYYGSIGTEYAISCCTDPSGNVFMCGTAPSSAVIATTGAHQTIYGGGTLDGYLVKFNSLGIRQWGTYYGGSGSDYARICKTDGFSNIFLSGHSDSNNGTTIATVGSHQNVNVGGLDNFLVKFADCPAVQSAPTDLNSTINTSVCAIGSFSINVLGYGAIGWFTFATGGTAIGTGTTYITPTLTNTTTYYAQDSSGCGVSPRTPITVTVYPNPTIMATSSSTAICVGQTANLIVTGANTYTWNNGSTSSTQVVSPIVTTTYTVNGTDANGCSNSAFITQSVSLCTGINSVAEALEATLQIFPNPSNEILNVISTSSITDIQILNTLGQVVYQSAVTNVIPSGVEEQKSSIKIQQLSNGIYFVKILSGNKVIITQKIIKD
ncbi:MAG: T9SS type A sorting domain-containing protein [Bacteroidota bacterium]|nr:T9SS type A sorting domain-containing protein [Bacteroidota bacterium]